MIIADTNVLSEVMRPHPEPAVIAWLSRHSTEITVTAITVAELLCGAQRLPDGVRRRTLETAISGALDAVDILSFGEPEAHAYASIRTAQESAGLMVGTHDIQIAAMARTGGHQVATRNVAHFDRAGVVVVNPWTDD